MSVMKKIACGTIKEHIKMHETMKSYDDLRNEVLTMAMFHKVENNKNRQAPAPMDFNLVMEKIRASITGSVEAARKDDYINFVGEKKDDSKSLDDAIEEIMAMVKGKVNGREKKDCYICGKTGHLAKY